MQNQKQTAIQLFFAFFILVLSVPGIVRGMRSSIAQALYCDAKYGSVRDNVKGIANRCEAAYNYYPYNYYFSIWAGEAAYYKALSCEGDERDRLLSLASYWCDTGLRQNFYKSQLRALKTHLLERRSMSDAIEFWAAYVDWHFWEPYNHKVLMDLYCRAGRLEEACDEIRWLKGSVYYDEASRQLGDAWVKAKTDPIRARGR